MKDLQDLEKAIKGAEDVLEKSHIREHERRTKSGGVTTVKEHEDRRKSKVAEYVQKFHDKMAGSSLDTAKGWVHGIGGLSQKDKEAVWAGIQKRHYPEAKRLGIRTYESKTLGRKVTVPED